MRHNPGHGIMPQAVHVLDLVAAHLAVEEPRLGALRAFRAARRDAAPFGEAIGLQEPAQCRVGRYGLEIGPVLGQRDEIVVVQLRAPTLMRGVLGKHGLAHGVAHRRLLAGIGAQLAPQ
jgi:hypothetical protein